MVIRPLTADDFDAIYAGFADAFSDYVVKFAPAREQLAEMMTRRGYVAEASVGAFEGERLVAFTLNGVDGEAGYDTGTGVVPSHRRRGLAREVMERSFELLRARGCTRYVLEVIDANRRAHELYRALGFEETRGLQCWTFESGAHASPATADTDCRREDASDVEPSWQNTLASIARAREPRVTVAEEHGCAIVFPSNGDLPRLVVDRAFRRRGIGTRLLHAAAATAGKPLRIVNVDERDRGVAAFLERAGAKRTLRQLEMVRPL